MAQIFLFSAPTSIILPYNENILRVGLMRHFRLACLVVGLVSNSTEKDRELSVKSFILK